MSTQKDAEKHAGNRCKILLEKTNWDTNYRLGVTHGHTGYPLQLFVWFL